MENDKKLKHYKVVDKSNIVYYISKRKRKAKKVQPIKTKPKIIDIYELLFDQ